MCLAESPSVCVARLDVDHPVITILLGMKCYTVAFSADRALRLVPLLLCKEQCSIHVFNR